MSIPILHRAIRTRRAGTRRAGTRRAGTRRAGTFFRKVRAKGRDLFPKGPRDRQGPFSERSGRWAGTFFRKVRANAWRMQGRCGFSFSPHSQDASEKRPCLRRRFGMPRPLVAARQGREAHSAWPQAKASLPKKMLRSRCSPLTPALPAQTSPRCHHFVDYAPSKNPPKFRKITSNISNFTFPSILPTAFTLKAKIPPTDSQ